MPSPCDGSDLRSRSAVFPPSLAFLYRIPHGKFHGGLSPDTALLPSCTTSCFQNNNLLILEYDPT